MDAASRSRYERRVRKLAGSGRRGSATEGERQAAVYSAEELAGLGLEPATEPFAGSRSLGTRLLHVGVAAAGAASLWRLPGLTILLGAVALGSLVVESTMRGRLLGRLVLRDRSCNVVARLAPRRGEAELRLPRGYPPRILAMCARFAAERRLSDAGPRSVAGFTDGLAFLVRGVPGLTVVGARDDGRLPHWHRPTDDLQRMDFDAAWRGVEFACGLMQRLAALARDVGSDGKMGCQPGINQGRPIPPVSAQSSATAGGPSCEV